MFLSFLLSLNLFAFEGVLFERGTKKPLKEVNIFLLPAGEKIVTSNSGKFSFEGNLPEEIVINLPGYLRLKKIIVNENDLKTLYLEKESYDVFETTVTGRMNKRDESTKTMQQADFIKAPGAMEDPLKGVQNMAG